MFKWLFKDKFQRGDIKLYSDYLQIFLVKVIGKNRENKIVCQMAFGKKILVCPDDLSDNFNPLDFPEDYEMLTGNKSKHAEEIDALELKIMKLKTENTFLKCNLENCHERLFRGKS